MSWRDEAACRGSDPELFFPAAQAGEVLEAQVAAAKAVCSRCPVRAACLAEALERLPFGIAGGLTEDERAALRRQVSRSGRERRAGTSVQARLLAGSVAVREVAAEHGVSERTAQRWAARARAAQPTTGSASAATDAGRTRAVAS